jgi:hypothetical protein
MIKVYYSELRQLQDPVDSLATYCYRAPSSLGASKGILDPLMRAAGGQCLEPAWSISKELETMLKGKGARLQLIRENLQHQLWQVLFTPPYLCGPTNYLISADGIGKYILLCRSASVWFRLPFDFEEQGAEVDEARRIQRHRAGNSNSTYTENFGGLSIFI